MVVIQNTNKRNIIQAVYENDSLILLKIITKFTQDNYKNKILE